MSQSPAGNKTAPAPLSLTVGDKSHIGDVRRQAARFAKECGFGETAGGNVSIVASELATNLVAHAGSGELLVQGVGAAGDWNVELLALDKGPGMSDVARCLTDGYSTRGTPGNGLGAVKRLSYEFDIFSQPGQGTAVVSRIARKAGQKKSAVQWGAVCVPIHGETVCGDTWRLRETAAGFCVMLADGLGHGVVAATASLAAAAVFEAKTTDEPGQLIESSHLALSHTRGAAIATALLDTTSGVFRYAGLGNIAGHIYSQGNSKGLFSHNGTVGMAGRRTQEMKYDWAPGSLLVMHSDGVNTRWNLSKYPGLAGHHAALIAGVLYRDFKRGSDDTTVLAVRCAADI